MNRTHVRATNLPAGLRGHLDEIEVLRPDMQRRLLLEVRRGRDAALLLSEENSDANTQRALEAQVRTGQRATNRLICSNMRLVIWVVSRSRRECRWLDRDDLIQEGVRGLARAIEKFDLDRGTTLSTYATNWIRQAVQRAKENSGLVRIPAHVQDGTTGGLAARAWAERFDDMMSIEGLAADLEEVEAEFMAECGPSEWADTAANLGASVNDTDEYVDARVLEETVATVLAHLGAREAMVLRARCGLDGDRQTLEEIGVRLGVTRERVRQIEKSALEKCRCILERAR